MLTRTKIALAAALVMGSAAIASAQTVSLGFGPAPYYGDVYGYDDSYRGYGGWNEPRASVMVAPGGFGWGPDYGYGNGRYGRDRTSGGYASQPGNP